MPTIIAIDGPSGAGKGTVARAIAESLKYRHVDTGAMYRAVGWKAQRDGIALDDESAVAELARRADIIVEGGRVEIGAHDVTRAIRTPEIDKAASSVARLPRVREVLVARQRGLAETGGVVMEGRDIGTKVFPDAEVKIFLDAAPEIRGTRRFQQSPAAATHEASVVAELQARDQRDRTRANSPLVPAPDAVLIDSTYLTLDQVLARAVEVIEARLSRSQQSEMQA